MVAREKSGRKKEISRLEKAPTGITGLDEVTYGGLPRGRTTLVAGGAGSGKTILAMKFLLNGAVQYNEPGVFVSFEENPTELAENFASMGYDLHDLVARKKVVLEHIAVERSQIEETGEYDLEALFIRLDYARKSIGAKRMVLDTIEVLFAGLKNTAVLRSELRRLFRWVKDKDLTAIVTGERGDHSLTRHGLEEYVADCMILLDHRVIEQISTRRLRILKYRGTTHGTDEFPFTIDEKGISVLPITSISLDHEAGTERVTSGIPRLDSMLGGEGFYRGSSILVSGTAGTGKSSIAANFALATCKRGERCLYFAFEESASQIMRNMRSINVHLAPYVKKGLLRFSSSRPTSHGLEAHLSVIHKLIEEHKPSCTIFDPISNFIALGTGGEIKSMLTRVVDYLKSRNITAMFTNLTSGGGPLEGTDSAVSSIMDTWILLRDIESGGERNRGMYVLKSRGMAHSNQIREYVISGRGIDLLDVYTGPEGVLTGSARISLEAMEEAKTMLRQQEIERKRKQLDLKREELEAAVKVLQAKFEAEKTELEQAIQNETEAEKRLLNDRRSMATLRKADRL